MYARKVIDLVSFYALEHVLEVELRDDGEGDLPGLLASHSRRTQVTRPTPQNRKKCKLTTTP